MQTITALFIFTFLLLIVFLSCLLAVLYNKATTPKHSKVRVKMSSLKRMIEDEDGEE